jgi:hypothetical protein
MAWTRLRREIPNSKSQIPNSKFQKRHWRGSAQSENRNQIENQSWITQRGEAALGLSAVENKPEN